MRRYLAKRQKWHCPLCGEPLRTGKPVNIDHIIPRSRGGDSSKANLQLVHAECNTRKGNKMPEE